MKRILNIILLLAILSIFPTNLSANPGYRFDVDNREINFVHGMEHHRINGTMTSEGEQSNQYYNYLNTKNATNEDYHLVSIENYTNGAYGMHSLATFIEKFENENPHLEVLAGVNGDFYHISSTGQGINTLVRDYEVIIPGSSNSKSLITDNEGNSYFKDVQHDGNEIIVFNEFREIKFRQKIDGLNVIPTNDQEITVLFDNYIGNIPTELSNVFIKGIDIKPLTNRDITHPNYYTYAKGNKTESLSETKVPENHFVIVSEQVNNIIEDGDEVVFQTKIKDFENVRSALSTYKSSGLLVKDSVLRINPDKNRHPRTAIGIKENGDVIIIVVDGRDRITPKHGVKLQELGSLMLSYGAVEAYNYDGGGSSTLMLRNNVEDGDVLDRFDVLNELSDGRLRSLSNGLLVVKGEVLSKPIDISTVENRGVFNTPGNLYIDEKLNLHFDKVNGAEKYEIFINDLMVETSKNYLALAGLRLGENEIRVRVKGTLENSTSASSFIINYKVHSREVSSLVNLLKNFQ